MRIVAFENEHGKGFAFGWCVSPIFLLRFENARRRLDERQFLIKFRFERDDVATRRINGFPTTNDDASSSSSSSLCIRLRAIRDLDRVLLCLDLSFRDRRPIIGPSEGENDSKQPRALAPVSLYKFFWFELLFGGRSCLKIYAVKQQASKHH